MTELDNSTLVFGTADTDITYYIDGTSGTDDATNIYFNPNTAGQSVSRIVIRPSATVSITKLNGKTLKDPIVITTLGFNPEYIPGFRYSKVVIHIDTADTKVDFTVFWSDTG